MSETLQIKRPALRYFGGKFRLAPWILKHFPPHRIYVEPFGGAASVLLQEPRSYSEVYNDLDGEIVNFFRVLRCAKKRKQLIEAIALTPYARDEFDLSWQAADDPVERARRTAIRAQMGFGSAGAVKGSTGFRVDTRRLYGTAQHDWVRYPPAIAAAGARLQGVLIENRPAVDVMQQHDDVDSLHFVDPPYVHETRQMKASGGYRFELSDDDHEDLVAVLKALNGKVILCGYESDLYCDLLSGWKTFATDSRISSSRGSAIRREVIWLNEACAEAFQRDLSDLFQGAA